MAASRQVREVLGSLSLRGRCLLTAGLGCIIGALLLGESDLLRVAALLIVTPLLAAVLVYRTRYRLRCERTVIPGRIPTGESAQVVLELANVGRLTTSALVVEDQIPYSLGARPRFTLPRLSAGGRRSGGYSLRCEERGRYRIGPLVVRLTDPFGCCEVTRSFSATNDLVVVPSITPLPRVPLGGSWAGLGESGGQSAGALGEDDAAVRDYRLGDDLRKVHWRSTAHAGALMVRQEAQPWVARATLLLDNRLAGHHGTGRHSSFEYAVEAAASIADHLSARGFGLRLVTGTGRVVSVASASEARIALLDELAVVSLNRRASIGGALQQVVGDVDRGVTIAILGELDGAETRALAGLAGRRAPALALLLDAGTWGTGQSQVNTRRTRLRLEAAGWRTAVAHRDSPLGQLWEALAAEGTAASLPAGPANRPLTGSAR